MSNREFLEQKVELKDSKLIKHPKFEVYDLKEHCNALSLCNEIGTSPHVEVHLKLNDEVPLFVY